MQEFADFCSHNLVHLEREKHIRALQESLKHTSKVRKSFIHEEDDLENHLRRIFRIADTHCSGTLSHTEIQNLFRSLDIHLTPFELSVIFSETDTNHDGLINYEEFVPVCVDLLKVLHIDNDQKKQRDETEKIAHDKATEICNSITHEVEHASKFIRTQFEVVMSSIEDSIERAKTLKDILNDPQSGLSRQEANTIYIRLLTNDLNFKKEMRLSVHDALRTSISTGSVKSVKLNDLEEIIREARRSSLVRNFMEDVNKGFIRDQIFQMLEAASASNRDSEGHFDGIYIPVRHAYECLENLTSLRLHRAEIISMISFADCYDETGQYLDAKRFAAYAAGCIENLTSVAGMESRAIAAKKGNLTEKKVMNGMNEHEIRQFLEKEFMVRSDQDRSPNLISRCDLEDIITNVPGIYITKKESTAVIASFKHTKEGDIDIREFLKGAYSSFVTVCFERYLSRRAKLVGHNRNGDVMGVTSLAERLLDILKLKLKGHDLFIVFPAEDHIDTSKRFSLIYNPPGSASPPSSKQTRRASHGDNDDTSSNKTVTMSGESAMLMNCAISLPVEIIEPTKAFKKSQSFQGRRVTEILKAVKDASASSRSMYGVASIYENDTFTFPDKAPLEFEFVSADSSFAARMPMPVRMPSLGLVDAAVAEEFAEQLVRFFFLEFDTDTSNYTLKFNDSDL